MFNRSKRRVAIRYRWDRLKVSFWFAPVVMSLAAALFAWLMYWVDMQIPNELLETSRFVLAGTPGEMRSILIGMAGTVMATAGVVFTLLTLPLSTVAAQFGPGFCVSSWVTAHPSWFWVCSRLHLPIV
jgi:uncharacterized membrane protein